MLEFSTSSGIMDRRTVFTVIHINKSLILGGTTMMKKMTMQLLDVDVVEECVEKIAIVTATVIAEIIQMKHLLF